MKYQPVYSGDVAIRDELQRIAAVLESIDGSLHIAFVAPERPREGMVRICDGTSWNPLGDGIRRPVWYDGLTASWRKFE